MIHETDEVVPVGVLIDVGGAIYVKLEHCLEAAVDSLIVLRVALYLHNFKVFLDQT